ncbi:CDPK-related protein kinase [Hordeum vulgare]|nr:CDPK-related protein kinase [Hordeum vulgare]
MWGRIWSSGRGSGSRSGDGNDPERERRVRSDAATKRGAKRWTNRGLSPLPSFLVRETEEYDHLHGRTPSSAAGSSSSTPGAYSYAGSSSSSDARLLPMKRQWSEEPEETEDVEEELVPVKEEPKELGRRGVVGPEDFVADVDAVAAAIAERSLHEEAERRRHDEKIEDLEWRQAVEANLAAKAKDGEWRRIREEQRAMYIDLCSSGEED